jgi:hypothetical protein
VECRKSFGEIKDWIKLTKEEVFAIAEHLSASVHCKWGYKDQKEDLTTCLLIKAQW